MLNYQKLIDLKPFSYGTHTNSLGQTIEFFEHPLQGQDAPVICVCHDLKLAASSTFYETTDMVQDHKEYEPKFVDSKFFIGDFEA